MRLPAPPTYTFGSCASQEDTYLRIYAGTNPATAILVDSNDDFGPLCASSRASIEWNCTTTGAYSVVLTHFPCTALQSGASLSYERSILGCSGMPNAGTVTVTGTASGCGNVIRTLTLSGYTQDVNSISIQWQSAPPGGSFTDIAGATQPTYTTPSISTTTRYRAAVKCDNTNQIATTSEVTITVYPNPAVTVSPLVTTICAGSPTTTTLTASGTNSYVWTAGGSGSGASQTYSPTATTLYEVTGINTATGCSTTRRATIIV